MDFQLPKACQMSTAASDVHLHFGGVSLPSGTIYLDYAASTPLRVSVLEKMKPWLLSYVGNSANRLHPMGEMSEHCLAQCREDLANLLTVKSDEIIFTSSATESNNLALRGLFSLPSRKRNKLVIGATEHSSVYTTAQVMADNLGLSLAILPVDEYGHVRMNEAAKIIDDNTLLVSLMDVNNETGVIQKELKAVCELAHSAGAYFHVDAVQGFARHGFSSKTVDFDLATISSSKIYGPKGSAALIVRKRKPKIKLLAQLTGGGHEFDLRSSTTNIGAILGFVEAAKVLWDDYHIDKMRLLEKAFFDVLDKKISYHVYGKTEDRVPGIFMMRFPNANAMKVIEEAKTICVSAGSACQTLQATASHVLVAMGVELEEALSSFRVSFGIPTSTEEVKRAAEVLSAAAKKVYSLSATLKTEE